MFPRPYSSRLFRLRIAPIAALAMVLAGAGSIPATAQRYLTEIVISTTNPSVAPNLPAELEFGSALNAYLLVDESQLQGLLSWYRSDGQASPPPISVVLSSDRAALERPQVRAMLPGSNNKIMVIAVSHERLSEVGLAPQDLANPRKASLVGIVSPRDLFTRLRIGKARLHL